MKAKKLKSGNWNVRVFMGRDEQGKQIFRSITAPTKDEVLKKAALLNKSIDDNTVSLIVNRYIEVKKPVLSPSTYRSYMGIYKTHIEKNKIGTYRISQLTSDKVQKWVSEIAKSRTPKTVRNCYGLLTATLEMFAPGTTLNVTLPQSRPTKLYTPTTDDINKLLEYTKTAWPETYKAILLASVGMMRRGEIAALTADDLNFEKNTITITKSEVKTRDNKHLIKQPKTLASVRVIAMPQYVMDALPREGKTVNLNCSQITGQFIWALKQVNLPHFRFHDLRHYAASIAASSSVGAATETIKARGGWATDNVMKRVYINRLEDEVMKDQEQIIAYYEKNMQGK